MAAWLVLIAILFYDKVTVGTLSEEEPYPIYRVREMQYQGTNDEVKLSLELLYPNGCYRIARTVAALDFAKREFLLINFTRLTEGPCTMNIVRAIGEVSFATPPYGTFVLYDVSSKSKLGSLSVEENKIVFLPDDGQ